MASLAGLYPYPTGWYAVAFSKDLSAGEVVTVHYFGKDIVLYRTDEGEAIAVEPFCPHLGAHLGHGGKVQGSTLTCPFHGWQFGADGACVGVPDCDKLPRQARLSHYPIVEQDDVICVFHDAHSDLAGADHSPTGEPFPFPALALEGYTEGQHVQWTLRSHPQEVCENTVDMAHLRPIHGVIGAHVVKKPIVAGSHLNVVLEFVAPGDLIGMPGEDNDVQLDVIADGLGRIVSRTHVKNNGVRAQQAIYCTPVDGEIMHLRGVVNTKKSDDADFTRELAKLFFDSFVHDFAKDFPIWENKRYVERPVLSAADGPVGLYRRWARQFNPQAGLDRSEQIDGAEPSERTEQRRGEARKPSLLAMLSERVRDAVLSPEGVVVGAVQSVRAVWSRGDAAAAEPSDDAGAMAPTGRVNGSPNGAQSNDAQFNDAQFNDAQFNDAQSNGAQSKGAPVDGAVSGGLRVSSAEEYFDTLADRFVPAGSKGVEAVFQWSLSGKEGIERYAVVRDGSMDLHTGQHHQPTVTIAMDSEDYVRLVNREIDGAFVFTSGRGKLKGSIPMAMKMRKIFPQ